MRRSPSHLLAVALVLSLAGALVACPSTKPADHPAMAPSVVIVNGPSTTQPPFAGASSTPSAAQSAPGPLLLGESCSVRAPRFSDDGCAVDADCAPLAVCHADACVAAAKAGVMKPGTMCTADCRSGTLDCGCNHCGCRARADGQKRCAVLAGRASTQ